MSKERLFFEIADRIDELVDLESPTQDDINELLSLINTDALNNYFFKQISTKGNTSWFQPLREQGFFDKSPGPVKVEGGITYPRWPAFGYLVSIASQFPDEVITISEETQIENPFLMSELIRIAPNIPLEYSYRLATLINKWLDRGKAVDEDIITLVKYWAEKDEWDSSLTLVDSILTPQVKPTTNEFRDSSSYSSLIHAREYDYFVESFVDLTLKDLIRVKSDQILPILEKNLILSFELQNQVEQEEKTSWWRQAIEPSEQNYQTEKIKDYLIESIDYCLQNLILTNPSLAQQIVENYLHHRFSIFRRLAIHTIRTTEQLWSNYLEQLFTEKKYWEDISYYHEYWLFTHDTFKKLPKNRQKGYVDRLIDEMSQDIGDDKNRHNWIYRRLWAIKNNLPTPESNKIFFELKEMFGDPDPPAWFAFLSYSHGFRQLVPVSPVKLSELSLDEILTELKKEYPSELTTFDEPSREGLASELADEIKKDPLKFGPMAPQLIDEEIHPVFLSYAISGFRDAWKEQKPIDWKSVLKLCNAVSEDSLSQSSTKTPLDLAEGYWENTYASAYRSTIDLLETAVIDDNHAIPHEFLNDVRQILINFTDTINPSPEYEAERVGNFGYLNLALNVNRAKALGALISYSLHRARVVKNDLAYRGLLPQDVNIEPEVLTVLTDKLNKEEDPSKAVHSHFGKFLPNLHFLNKDWLLSHLDDIFPRDPEKINYWEVAWDGYLWRSDFYNYLYPFLKPYYWFAVEQFALGSDGHAGSELSQSRLAGHLALLYWHGEESLDGNESLIEVFLLNSSDKLRAEFIKRLVPSKVESPMKADSPEWNRMKTLWHKRYNLIREGLQSNDSKEFHNELATYLLWVPNIPEPLENYYEMIETSALIAETHFLLRLFEYLTTVVEDHTLFIISLFEKLLVRGIPPYFTIAKREDIEIILNKALTSDDSLSKESAIRVINIFGEHGDERYRDLLQFA